MRFKRYLRTVSTLPPQTLAKVAVVMLLRRLASLRQRRRDANHSTYVELLPFSPGEFYSYFRAIPMDLLRLQSEKISALSDNYLAHRFDLLGSGWVQVQHGMRCRGLEGYRFEMGKSVRVDREGGWLRGRINPANLTRSQRIWRLVDLSYAPIDWQLDFKSGYRWSEATWYLDIPYGHKLGVDIKVPWELARMQHLPQLAWACALARDGQAGFAPAQRYVRAFRNQVLDFIATNPPRFGVNWHSSMDVGIRVANWLVTFDLFRAAGTDFGVDFESAFSRSIYEHGLHIVSNLEWNPELRGNHYLAHIVGLLFVAAYLPCTPETDAWLALAVQELVKEVELQFNLDGTSFEASTCYHRLAAELVLYATALVLGLPEEKRRALRTYDRSLIKVRPGLEPPPQPHYPLHAEHHLGGAMQESHDVNSTPRNRTPFPFWYMERLEKIAEFTIHITKPNGHVPQVGDNDNGRFLKLQPRHQRMSVAEAKARYANLAKYNELGGKAAHWDEDHLDHSHLVAAINGLFGKEEWAIFSGTDWLETDLVRSVAGGMSLPTYHHKGDPTSAELLRVGTQNDWERLRAKVNSYPEGQRRVLEIDASGGDLRQRLKLYGYPDFGLYLYCSQRLYLAVRCGPIGQNGNGGHAHNDQLSLELNLDGQDWITDPGTYLYTPLPQRRNEYRSVRAHFAPQVVDGKEPGRLDLGLFRLGDETKAKCLYFGPQGFVGVHWGYGQPVYRLVAITENMLKVIDAAEGHKLSNAYNAMGTRASRELPKTNFSESWGYGCRAR